MFNEEESLPELYAWIERVMKANNFTYEVIFVNDGSTDNSWNVIESLSQKSPAVKGIKFRRNYGKSPALFCGFKEAEGDVVITMDADLQDSPDEIPALYHMIVDEGYDLVSGYKQNLGSNMLCTSLKLYIGVNTHFVQLYIVPHFISYHGKNTKKNIIQNIIFRPYKHKK